MYISYLFCLFLSILSICVYLIYFGDDKRNGEIDAIPANRYNIITERLFTMTLQAAIKQKNMSIYRLAKESGIPYATVNDVCNGKARLEKCSAETIYRLSRTLDITMEDLLAPCFMKRASFENFKSTVCHRLKELGDIGFIIDTLESREIRTFFEQKWYPECFYLLAMLDYISRENAVPLCDDYDDLRQLSLERPVFPSGVRAMSLASGDDAIMQEAVKTSIPEFRRFNIIENEVRRVV